MGIRLLWLGWMAAVAAAPAAATIVVPPYAISGTITNNDHVVSVETAGQYTGNYRGTQLLNVELTPTPSVFVSATSDQLYGPSAQATLTYYFTLIGGGSDPVPLLAHVRLATTDSGQVNQNTAYASVYIQQHISAAPVRQSVSYNQTFDDYLSFGMRPGETNFVEIAATASIGYRIATVSAYADPYIFIDPAYLAAHPGLSLAFSAGAGNVPPAAAVPEPATWALLFGGFALTGAAMRRRTAMARVAA